MIVDDCDELLYKLRALYAVKNFIGKRMDGKNHKLTKIVTHFESDYSTPRKIKLPIGTGITMLCVK